jgi:putative GTP pyrophosphokinase
MKITPKDSPAEEFERLRPEYERFTQKLDILLRDLLRARDIDFHLQESRTKENSSLREKIVRSAKTSTGPLNDVTDLSGLRVITYYEDDAIAVANLIESEFAVDRENSIVHSAVAAEFGYKSAHYVVKLSPGRAALLEWNGLSDLKAEIQVRTVLQHAWAAISHKLQYKREDDVPAILKRKLFRLSALFEIADDEFVSLRDASGAVTRKIGELVSSGDRSLPLDYVSLTKLLDTSIVVAELCAAAAEVGFDFDDVDGAEYENEDHDTVSDLIQLSTFAGISTIEQFESLLDSTLPWAREYLQAQYAANQRMARSSWSVTPPFVCELMLVCAGAQHIRLGHLLRLGFDRGIGNRVVEIAKQFPADKPKSASLPTATSVNTGEIPTN